MKWLVDIVFFTICLVALAVIAVLTFRVKRDETIEKKDDTDLFENRDRNDLFAHSLRAYIRGLQNCDDAVISKPPLCKKGICVYIDKMIRQSLSQLR